MAAISIQSSDTHSMGRSTPLNLLFQNDRLFHVTAKELVGYVHLVRARMQVGGVHRCAPVGRSVHARIRYDIILYIVNISSHGAVMRQLSFALCSSHLIQVWWKWELLQIKGHKINRWD